MSQLLSEMSLSSATIIGGGILLLFALIMYPTTILRYLDRLRYQYEVTSGLYIMTSTEKFILNSIFLLIFSMVGIAACLYLPEHLSIMFGRALYYIIGDDTSSSSTKIAAASNLSASSIAV